MFVFRQPLAVMGLACAGTLGIALAANESESEFVDRPARTPESWIELPALAESVPLQEPSFITSRHGLGDPSQGVYVFWQRLRPTGANLASKLPGELAKMLQTKGESITQSHRSQLDFVFRDQRGSIAIDAEADGGTRILTCFYNGRESERSKRECAAIVAAEPSN